LRKGDGGALLQGGKRNKKTGGNRRKKKAQLLRKGGLKNREEIKGRESGAKVLGSGTVFCTKTQKGTPVKEL